VLRRCLARCSATIAIFDGFFRLVWCMLFAVDSSSGANRRLKMNSDITGARKEGSNVRGEKG
jgi:hypothetical protein